MEKTQLEKQPIVCATRGGKACQSTQGQAIHLAQERGAELIFLFVADTSFAGPLDDALETALIDELTRLGRSILHMAQKRAGEKGLDAKAVVRQGRVRENIEAYLRQVDASTLVIGSPETSSSPQMFTDDELNQFGSAIQQATGVEVVIAN
jgi:nucleotide-binding universal stress UspA family protein